MTEQASIFVRTDAECRPLVVRSLFVLLKKKKRKLLHDKAVFLHALHNDVGYIDDFSLCVWLAGGGTAVNPHITRITVHIRTSKRGKKSIQRRDDKRRCIIMAGYV